MIRVFTKYLQFYSETYQNLPNIYQFEHIKYFQRHASKSNIKWSCENRDQNSNIEEPIYF